MSTNVSSSASSSSGIGVCGLLGILFVGLKLTGFIDWSWWWVTLPFWGGFAFLLSLLVLGGIGVVLYELFSRKK
jgi:hypothetical protein